MPERNWHHVVAYLGLGAALGFMVAAATLPNGQPYSETEQSGASEPAQSAEKWAANVCAAASQSDAPETAEKRQDLCAQFRAAAAAERSAVFDEQQVTIGWLTFGGLLATIFIAWLAWRESKRSADADNEALRVANNQIAEARTAAAEQATNAKAQLAAALASAKATQELATQDRARLHVEVVGLDQLKMLSAERDGTPALYEGTVKVLIRNLGRSPAVIADGGISAELYWLFLLPIIEVDPVSEEMQGYRSIHRATADSVATQGNKTQLKFGRILRIPEDYKATGGADNILDGDAQAVGEFRFRWRRNASPHSDPAHDTMFFLFQIEYTDVYGIVRETSLYKRLNRGAMVSDIGDAEISAQYNYRT